jgi:hypothetical protein
MVSASDVSHLGIVRWGRPDMRSRLQEGGETSSMSRSAVRTSSMPCDRPMPSNSSLHIPNHI